MAAVTVMNYRGRTGSATAQFGGSAPQRVHDAEKFSAVGHTRGGIHAPVRVVVFSDFECPYCRTFATRTMPHIDSIFGDSVRVVFRHMPLPGHRLAYPAARAAECAGEQGRFWEFHDAVFQHQDSLGILPLTEFAVRAGGVSQKEFESCIGRSEPVPAIEVDRDASESLKLRGTPGLLVGEILLQGLPTNSAMDSLINVVLREKR